MGLSCLSQDHMASWSLLLFTHSFLKGNTEHLQRRQNLRQAATKRETSPASAFPIWRESGSELFITKKCGSMLWNSSRTCYCKRYTWVIHTQGYFFILLLSVDIIPGSKGQNISSVEGPTDLSRLIAGCLEELKVAVQRHYSHTIVQIYSIPLFHLLHYSAEKNWDKTRNKTRNDLDAFMWRPKDWLSQ